MLNDITFLMVVSKESVDTVKATLDNIQQIGGRQIVVIYDHDEQDMESFVPMKNLFKTYNGLSVKGAAKHKQGLTASLNQGLELIGTRLTSRVDPGDISTMDRLQYTLSAFERNPDLLICGCKASLNSEDNKMIYCPRSGPDQWVNKQLLLAGNPLAHGSITFLTESIKRMQGYDTRFKYSQDYDLYERVLSVHGEKSILLLGRTYYQRVISTNSISFQKAEEQSGYSNQVKTRISPEKQVKEDLKRKSLKKKYFTLAANGNYGSLLKTAIIERNLIYGMGYIIKLSLIRNFPFLSSYIYKN